MKKKTTNEKILDQKLLNLTSSIQVKNEMVVFYIHYRGRFSSPNQATDKILYRTLTEFGVIASKIVQDLKGKIFPS